MQYQYFLTPIKQRWIFFPRHTWHQFIVYYHWLRNAAPVDSGVFELQLNQWPARSLFSSTPVWRLHIRAASPLSSASFRRAGVVSSPQRDSDHHLFRFVPKRLEMVDGRARQLTDNSGDGVKRQTHLKTSCDPCHQSNSKGGGRGGFNG